jgi:hypothetical protein
METCEHVLCNCKFWKHVEKTSKEVQSWPEWKRGKLSSQDIEEMSKQIKFQEPFSNAK